MDSEDQNRFASNCLYLLNHLVESSSLLYYLFLTICKKLCRLCLAPFRVWFCRNMGRSVRGMKRCFGAYTSLQSPLLSMPSTRDTTPCLSTATETKLQKNTRRRKDICKSTVADSDALTAWLAWPNEVANSKFLHFNRVIQNG